MELSRAIYSRRAVREYTPEPLDDFTLRQLIEAAVQAPSAVNEQPWIFSVVRDPHVLSRISQAAKAHVLTAPTALDLPDDLRERLANPDFDILYHAPVLIVISSSRQSRWSDIDCALAAENLMLAARDAGIGSCWIGMAQDWLGTPEGKATIGLVGPGAPVAPIILGHPQLQATPVGRRAPEIIWIGNGAPVALS